MGSRITGRAVAVIVLVGLLTLSYATSLRVWLDQRQQIAQLNADIRATEERITDLEAELQRWEDPEYVKIQARQRLGWVVPGETGYRVVGPDGKPLGGGAVIDSGEQTEQSSAWYDKVFGSVKTADDPEPAKAQPSGAPRTVGPPPGEETTPSATPTPR